MMQLSSILFSKRDNKPVSNEKSVEKRAISIHNPLSKISAWINQVFNRQSDEITLDEVFGLSSVWRAIKIISEPLASIGMNHYQEQENGDVVVKDGDLNILLSKTPSPYYSAFTWIETFMVHILVTGNAYIEIIRLGSGKIKEFRLIDPGAIEDIFLQGSKLLYKIAGRDKPIISDNMIHIPGLGFNGFVGKNPIEIHRETLILDKESRQYAKNIYGNGAFLSGVLQAPGPVSDEAYYRMKNTWQDAYGGSKNAGKTPLLEEGVTFQPIKLSPVDAQWIETRNNIDEEVSRIYGVPLHMLSKLDRATFNNIEHQDLELNKYTLMPWASRVEAEFNRKLFPDTDKEFVKFNTDQLLRGDIESMTKWLESHFQMGTMNRNEIRRKYLHLPGVEHGETYFIAGNNMIPVDKAVRMEPTEQIVNE